jgi:geranylgeranyl pyrophosphate synthase
LKIDHRIHLFENRYKTYFSENYEVGLNMLNFDEFLQEKLSNRMAYHLYGFFQRSLATETTSRVISNRDLHNQLHLWLYLSLGLPLSKEISTTYKSNSPKLILPKFFLEVSLAVANDASSSTHNKEGEYRNESVIPDKILDAASGIEFLSRASAIFDAIQDNDGSNSLVKELPLSCSLNIGAILLQLGQNTITKAILSSKKSLGVEVDTHYLIDRLHEVTAGAFRGQLLDVQEHKLSMVERVSGIEYALYKAELKTGQVFSYLAELAVVLTRSAYPFTNCITQSENDKQLITYREFGTAYGLVLHLLDDLQEYSMALQSPQNSRDLQYRHLTLPFIFSYKELQTEQERVSWLDFWQSSSWTGSTETSGKKTKSEEGLTTEAFVQLLRNSPAFLKTIIFLGGKMKDAEYWLLRSKNGSFNSYDEPLIQNLRKGIGRMTDCYKQTLQKSAGTGDSD